jgi:Cu-processing system ATP-binding protein
VNNPTIELEGVAKTYGRERAVDDVSLVVHPGECMALVGHNGAGKTTLMKLMLGLARPSAGRVRVLGGDPSRSDAARRRLGVGFLPENVAFDAALTGREVLAFFAKLKGVPANVGIELLARVGLADAAGRRVRTYSKGMRQRLGLAQALLGEPRVLLLDEATSGLDPALRQSFYEMVRELAHGGATILLSSHVLTELEARTDRVAIMNQGRLAALGTLDELRRMAGLSLRIRVAVPDGTAAAVAERLGDNAEPARINDCSVELLCEVDSKMAVLRDITGLGSAIRDVEIAPPSFDQVYAHFSERENG